MHSPISTPFCQLCSRLMSHCPLLSRQVGFVANQHHDGPLRGVPLQLCHPVLRPRKRLYAAGEGKQMLPAGEQAGGTVGQPGWCRVNAGETARRPLCQLLAIPSPTRTCSHQTRWLLQSPPCSTTAPGSRTAPALLCPCSSAGQSHAKCASGRQQRQPHSRSSALAQPRSPAKRSPDIINRLASQWAALPLTRSQT